MLQSRLSAVLLVGTALAVLTCSSLSTAHAALVVSAPNTAIVTTALINETGVSGVFITNTAAGSSFNNSTTITSDTKGIDSRSTLGNAGFVNSGTIDGASRGVIIDFGTSTTVFDNTGTIQSNLGTALDMQGEFGYLVHLGNVTSNGTIATFVLGSNQTASNSLLLNGLVTNTALDNTAIALAINASQNTNGGNALINTGSLIADGTGIGQAHAVSFAGNIGGTVINRGVIRGEVTAITGAQNFINDSGTLIGNVSLGDGANTVAINGGTVTGNVIGGIDADTITISGGALNGTINAGDGDNVVTLSGGATNAGNTAITTGSGNDHIVISGGTHVANALQLGAGNDQLDLNGGAFYGNLDFGSGANALNINQAITATQTITSSGTLDLHVGPAGTLNLRTAIGGLYTIATDAQSVMTVWDHNVAHGALLNNGRLTIAADKNLTVDSYNAASTGTLAIGVGADNTFLLPGRLIVSHGGADLSQANIVFSIAPNSDLPPASTAYTFAQANNGGVVTLPNASQMSDTSLLYDFTTAGSTTDTATVAATRVAGGLQTLAGPKMATLGAVLENNLASDNAEIAALQVRLASLDNQAAMSRTLESVTPTADNSASDSANTMAVQSQNLATDRMADLRSGETGMSSGDDALDRRVWLRPFATKVSQKGCGTGWPVTRLTRSVSQPVLIQIV